MKKFLAVFALFAVLAFGVTAPVSAAKVTSKNTQVAKAVVVKTVVKPSYCGPGEWATSYRAIYEYPTGSYWVGQINAYPDYYAANHAKFLAKYGC